MIQFVLIKVFIEKKIPLPVLIFDIFIDFVTLFHRNEIFGCLKFGMKYTFIHIPYLIEAFD